MKFISKILGTAGAFFFLLMGFLYNDGRIAYFLHPGEFMMVIFVPLGIMTATHGFTGLSSCLGILKFFFISGNPNDFETLVYTQWLKSTYHISIAAFLLGIVALTQFINEGLMVMGERFAAACSSIILAIIICEFIIRPVLQRAYKTPR